MSKRKKGSNYGQSETHINPLAQARGRRSNNSTAAAQDIWFRKSGLGYDLFVQYYAHQFPDLIVEEVPQSQKACSSSSAKIVPGGSGGGQSRAAKRRRRNHQRKLKSGEDVPQNPTDQQTQDATIPCSSSSSIMVATDSHPLMQAFQNFILHRQSKQSDQTTVSSPFFRSLSQPLPITFRIRRTAPPYALSILQRRLEQQPPFSKTSFLVIPIDAGQHQSSKQHTAPNANSDWIYQWSSTTMEKNNHNDSVMTTLKDILFQNSQNGVLARQELGSMLPVLVIDAFLNQYHSSCSLKKESTCHENRDWNHCRVLDMCASPGSKTLQLYEHDPKLLIANDIHPGRLEALKDAIVRSGVPHAAEKIILTCQDATKIEFMAKKAKHSTTTISNDNKAPSLLKFDVILCDVPCSGDGTCRKDPHVLRNWKPSIGNQLHSTQVAILSRAVELLKKNGVICYSTCSLNPVENEAVVAAVLHKYGNNIELVQIPTISSRLMLRDGMSQWKVAHWNDDQNNGIFQDELDGEDDGCGACLQLTWLDSYDDAVKGTKIRSTVKQWMPSLWPPPTSTGAPDMNLSYCKRLWPHDQNSGGFFVALLRNRTK